MSQHPETRLLPAHTTGGNPVIDFGEISPPLIPAWMQQETIRLAKENKAGPALIIVEALSGFQDDTEHNPSRTVATFYTPETTSICNLPRLYKTALAKSIVDLASAANIPVTVTANGYTFGENDKTYNKQIMIDEAMQVSLSDALMKRLLCHIAAASNKHPIIAMTAQVLHDGKFLTQTPIEKPISQPLHLAIETVDPSPLLAVEGDIYTYGKQQHIVSIVSRHRQSQQI